MDTVKDIKVEEESIQNDFWILSDYRYCFQFKDRHVVLYSCESTI